MLFHFGSTLFDGVHHSQWSNLQKESLRIMWPIPDNNPGYLTFQKKMDLVKIDQTWSNWTCDRRGFPLWHQSFHYTLIQDMACCMFCVRMWDQMATVAIQFLLTQREAACLDCLERVIYAREKRLGFGSASDEFNVWALVLCRVYCDLH